MRSHTDRRVVRWALLTAGIAVLPLANCGGPEHHGRAAVAPGPERSGVPTGGGSGPAVGLGDSFPGLNNFFVLAPGVFSGSGPETDEAFGSLAGLGVRTIISVDGSRPEVELAHEHGMRYVHIPIGYDGMEPEQALELAKAVETEPGPIYVHCHHGKHRGPTSAAVAMVGLGRMTSAQAAEFMHAAGTSDSYPGLWACAREQIVYSESDLAGAPDEFPEVQVVSGLVNGMVAIDKTWERVNLVRAAGWESPPDHPDLVAAAEAGMLADHFRVLAEDPEVMGEGEEFAMAMHRAAERASTLEGSLTRITRHADSTEQAYQAVASSCNGCHERWRN